MHASLGLAVVSAVALAACGAPPPSPSALLAQAKQVIDSASAAHFQLTSTGVRAGGNTITGGAGDIKRPNSFDGTLNVTVGGFSVSVQVISTGGTFYLKDPLSGTFSITNPAAYGFGDPSQLLDPQHGLSSLLLLCTSTGLGDDDRYNGEQLHEVTCMLPGHAVAALLTSADPSKSVSATFGIDPSSNQTRRVVLTGPFFNATANSTLTLIVDNYGENVTITPPPVGS
jgi:lipoprotein LprG